MESDLELLSELREVLSDQPALDGVLFRHDGGDSNHGRVRPRHVSFLGELFHQGSVLAAEADVEVDDVDEVGAVECFEEGLVSCEVREHRDR